VEHLQHFGLSQDPFQNEPDLRFYFESASHRDAQQRVERGLRCSKGLTLLTGEGGTGKSLLARRILDGLEEELFEASLMVSVGGQAGEGSLLRRFARQLEIEQPAGDHSALLGQVYEQLAVIREDGRHAVLIGDDVHQLCSEALAEVGGLLNLEYEDRRLVSLLLVGLPQLDEALAQEPSLGQRVDVRVRLKPLSLEDSGVYLAHRIRAVSGSPEIVPQAALSALHKFGRGRPRLMNTLADNALFEAFLAGRQQIGPMDVERAAADLGIGPDPGSTFQTLTSDDQVASQPPHPLEPSEEGAPVLGELTGPSGLDLEGSDPEEMAIGVEPSSPADDGPGLGELFEPAEDDAEMATVLSTDLPSLGLETDLDDSISLSAENRELPGLDAVNLSGPAEATRLALPDEDLSQISQEGEEGDDELDDLFVELLDD
jgi:type II secretory pathway predicted ATPase ExeA